MKKLHMNDERKSLAVGAAAGVMSVVVGVGIVLFFSGANHARASLSGQVKAVDANGKPVGSEIPPDQYRVGKSSVGTMYGRKSAHQQNIYGVTTNPDGTLNFSLNGGGKNDKGSLASRFITRPSNVPCIPSLVAAGANSPFGYRWHPTHFFWRIHNGLDFHATNGQELRAPFDGTAEVLMNRGEAGNEVVFKNQYYRITLMHQNPKVGGLPRSRSVKAGEVIGYAGSTGTGTGVHLHMMLQFSAPGSGRFIDGVDPSRFMCGSSAGTGPAVDPSSGAGNAGSSTQAGKQPDTGKTTASGPATDGGSTAAEEDDVDLGGDREQCPLIAETQKPTQPDPNNLPPANPLIHGWSVRPTRQ